MKILHTADWHLGAWAGPVDRGDDLRRAIERVMGYCESESVDVLLIAGDLFDEDCRREQVCPALQHLKGAFRPFLQSGGTILALTGNHDKETLSRTLAHALELGDPSSVGIGARLKPGRFHLATNATLWRLADRSGQEVQFALMPFPTPRVYLDGELTPYSGADGKYRRLLDGFRARLAALRGDPRFDDRLHTVLASHLFLGGVKLPNGTEVTQEFEAGNVVAHADDLSRGWAYVALGHVHKAQAVGGRDHVRYSGSIERLRVDEGNDTSVVLVEIGPEGLVGRPATLPLESTPYLKVEVDRFAEQAPTILEVCPEAGRALVHCRVSWASGVDDPDEIHRWIDATFPRCYRRDVRPVEPPRTIGPDPGGPAKRQGVREVVMGYLAEELRDRADRDAVIAAAEDLFEEVRP